MQQDQWFIVLTNPQRENFVAGQLETLEPYLPKFKTVKGRIAPLFSGYLFVPQIRHWGEITSTVGVRQLLMSGDHPACIPGMVIKELRGKERGGLIQLPPPPRFPNGARLMITRGSLKYRIVIYAGMNGKDRERVLIEMLGQHVSISVPTADLALEFGKATRNRLQHRRETFSGGRRSDFSDRSSRSF